MKRTLFKQLLTAIALVSIITSCGVSTNLPTNSNQNSTQVILSKNNYKVIEQLQGEIKVKYILGIGGKKKDLIARARTKMLENADLIGKSRAVINENVDVHIKYGLFTTKYTVTVSGYLIEFTE